MRRCLWCNETIEEVISFASLIYRRSDMKQMCMQCCNQLHPLENEEKKCSSCGKLCGDDVCPDCSVWKKVYPDYSFKHSSLYYYNDFSKAFIEKYKIAGDCELSKLFAYDLKRRLGPLEKKSLIIPIPMSEASRQKRGFNQVEVLLESAGIAYVPCLDNIGTGEKQSRKNKTERMKTEQPFILRPDKKAFIEGASIILVDDLYTTGRTLFHAADALKPHKPEHIETFSLFR